MQLPTLMWPQAPSDENSVFSDDDDDQLATQEESIISLISMQNSKEREYADRFDYVILPENYESENLAGGGNENEDGAPPSPPLPSTVTIVVNIKKVKVKALKELFKKFNIAMPRDKKRNSIILTCLQLEGELFI
jgi:hypothetical protein